MVISHRFFCQCLPEGKPTFFYGFPHGFPHFPTDFFHRPRCCSAQEAANGAHGTAGHVREAHAVVTYQGVVSLKGLQNVGCDCGKWWAYLRILKYILIDTCRQM